MTMIIAPFIGRINLVNLLPPDGTGVEIGTHIGEFAEEILNSWGGRLYCVDPWKKYPEYEEQYEFLWGREGGSFHQQAINRLSRFEDRCFLLKDTSENASRARLPELDFVYVDGNHSYKYVLQDLSLWYQKLCSRGILAGHDFFMPGAVIDNMQDEVQEAVMYFANIHALDIYIVSEIGEHPWSYYMIKP